MLLSTVIFLPLLFALLLSILSSDKAVRIGALVFSSLEFVLSLVILQNFDGASHQLQLAENYSWIPSYGINYFVGIDGISLWLVLLTTFLTPITILASWNSINQKVKSFHICMLILETAMLGTFLAMDAVLFYFFWELMLIPMYLLVGVGEASVEFMPL